MLRAEILLPDLYVNSRSPLFGNAIMFVINSLLVILIKYFNKI